MNKIKLAIFDIDGTIFRSSLLIEITAGLIAAGVFPKSVANIYTEAHQNWSNRQESYDQYIAAVVQAFVKHIKGVDYADFQKVARRVVAQRQNQVYRYTRELFQTLKSQHYYLLAISHSPKILVDAFCAHWGFDKVYGRILEMDKHNKFTGQDLFSAEINDKAKILQRALTSEGLTLTHSIGIGDSEADIPFLKMVKRPICFNPNSLLYRYAKRHDWEVVVERKDVIYKI